MELCKVEIRRLMHAVHFYDVLGLRYDAKKTRIFSMVKLTRGIREHEMPLSRNPCYIIVGRSIGSLIK